MIGNVSAIAIFVRIRPKQTRTERWGRKPGVSEAFSDLRSVLQSRSIAQCFLMRYMQCNYNAPQLWATLGAAAALPDCSSCVQPLACFGTWNQQGVLWTGSGHRRWNSSYCNLVVPITEVPQFQSPLILHSCNNVLFFVHSVLSPVNRTKIKLLLK